MEVTEETKNHRCAWGGVNSRSTPPGGHFLTPTPVEHFRPPPGQQVVPGPKAPYKSPIPSK